MKASTYQPLIGTFSTRDYWGLLTPWAEHYPSGGYLAYLPSKSMDGADEVVRNLKSGNWLDDGARLLIIDFHLYNTNVNQFVAVRLAFEMPAFGQGLKF